MIPKKLVKVKGSNTGGAERQEKRAIAPGTVTRVAAAVLQDIPVRESSGLVVRLAEHRTHRQIGKMS